MSKRITVGGLIVAVLLIIAAMAFLGNVTNGFQDFDKETISDNMSKKVNPDNYYTIDGVEIVDSNKGNGIIVDVNEKNGAIVLHGTANSDCTYTVGTVMLDAGKYTLTAIKGASLGTVYMTAETADGEVKFDFTPDNVLEIAEDETEVTLTIYIMEDAELNNVDVLPVIVEGEEAGNFYK